MNDDFPGGTPIRSWSPSSASPFLTCGVLPSPPALHTLRTWLGSWRGVGLITEAMWRQGYDLALTSDEHGWRATFLHHDPLTGPWVGQAVSWWSTPWRAVHEAAWRALNARPPYHLSLIEESPQ